MHYYVFVCVPIYGTVKQRQMVICMRLSLVTNQCQVTDHVKSLELVSPSTFDAQPILYTKGSNVNTGLPC